MFLALIIILSALFSLLYGIKFQRLAIPLVVGIFLYLFLRTEFSIIFALLSFIILVVFNVKKLNLVLLSLTAPLMLVSRYTTLPIIIIAIVMGIIFIVLSLTTERFSKFLTITLSAFIISYELCSLYYLSLGFFFFIFIFSTSISFLLSKKELIEMQK